MRNIRANLLWPMQRITVIRKILMNFIATKILSTTNKDFVKPNAYIELHLKLFLFVKRLLVNRIYQKNVRSTTSSHASKTYNTGCHALKQKTTLLNSDFRLLFLLKVSIIFFRIYSTIVSSSSQLGLDFLNFHFVLNDEEFLNSAMTF